MNLKLEIELSKSDIFKKVDSLKKQVDDMRPFPNDVERRIMEQQRLMWSFHSNALRGNKLTYNEAKAFLTEGIVAQAKSPEDYEEIRGLDSALTFALSIINDTRSISEADIKNLHKIILVEPYDIEVHTDEGLPIIDQVILGEYRTPGENSVKMQDLIEWYAGASTSLKIHPLVIAALFHHKFVSIHPFDDGNGRLSRILMNLILMKNGFPPVIILVGESQNYYSLLGKADDGDFCPLIEYLTEALEYSLESLSNWKSFRYQVYISGIVSEGSKRLIDKGFKIKGDERRTLNLFCWYSNLEIPIGATFNCFEKNNVQTFLKHEAVLIGVTQQLGKPFEVIPEGWKTIAKFEFSEQDVSTLKNELPVFNSWTFTEGKFYLIKAE